MQHIRGWVDCQTMRLSFLTILTLCGQLALSAEFLRHVQNSVYPYDVDPPAYNIESWVKQLHLQQCALVEVGDKYYAIFVESRPRRYDNEEGIKEYFLGLCDDETLNKWSFCAASLQRKRTTDCNFYTKNMYNTRVHRRLCDLTLLALNAPQCDCSNELSDSKLFKVQGFPTCFKPPLPTSLCGDNNVCGLAGCSPRTINKRVHSIKCDRKCDENQPFCEPCDTRSSQPRDINSFWTDWSNPYCTDTSCISQYDEAICINRKTGRGDIDCLGPGTSCCNAELQNCKCHVYEENGTTKVFRTFSVPQPEPVEYMSEEDFINSIPLRYLKEEFHRYPFSQSRPSRSYIGKAFKQTLANIYDAFPLKLGNTHHTHNNLSKIKSAVMGNYRPNGERSIHNSQIIKKLHEAEDMENYSSSESDTPDRLTFYLTRASTFSEMEASTFARSTSPRTTAHRTTTYLTQGTSQINEDIARPISLVSLDTSMGTILEANSPHSDEEVTIGNAISKGGHLSTVAQEPSEAIEQTLQKTLTTVQEADFTKEEIHHVPTARGSTKVGDSYLTQSTMPPPMSMSTIQEADFTKEVPIGSTHMKSHSTPHSKHITPKVTHQGRASTTGYELSTQMTLPKNHYTNFQALTHKHSNTPTPFTAMVTINLPSTNSLDFAYDPNLNDLLNDSDKSISSLTPHLLNTTPQEFSSFAVVDISLSAPTNCQPCDTNNLIDSGSASTDHSPFEINNDLVGGFQDKSNLIHTQKEMEAIKKRAMKIPPPHVNSNGVKHKQRIHIHKHRQHYKKQVNREQDTTMLKQKKRRKYRDLIKAYGVQPLPAKNENLEIDIHLEPVSETPPGRENNRKSISQVSKVPKSRLQKIPRMAGTKKFRKKTSECATKIRNDDSDEKNNTFDMDDDDAEVLTNGTKNDVHNSRRDISRSKPIKIEEILAPKKLGNNGMYQNKGDILGKLGFNLVLNKGNEIPQNKFNKLLENQGYDKSLRVRTKENDFLRQKIYSAFKILEHLKHQLSLNDKVERETKDGIPESHSFNKKDDFRSIRGFPPTNHLAFIPFSRKLFSQDSFSYNNPFYHVINGRHAMKDSMEVFNHEMAPSKPPSDEIPQFGNLKEAYPSTTPSPDIMYSKFEGDDPPTDANGLLVYEKDPPDDFYLWDEDWDIKKPVIKNVIKSMPRKAALVVNHNTKTKPTEKYFAVNPAMGANPANSPKIVTVAPDEWVNRLSEIKQDDAEDALEIEERLDQNYQKLNNDEDETMEEPVLHVTEYPNPDLYQNCQEYPQFPVVEPDTDTLNDEQGETNGVHHHHSVQKKEANKAVKKGGHRSDSIEDEDMRNSEQRPDTINSCHNSDCVLISIMTANAMEGDEDLNSESTSIRGTRRFQKRLVSSEEIADDDDDVSYNDDDDDVKLEYMDENTEIPECEPCIPERGECKSINAKMEQQQIDAETNQNTSSTGPMNVINMATHLESYFILRFYIIFTICYV